MNNIYKFNNHPPEKIAKKIQSKFVHNIEIKDEYAWLRAENWQEVLDNPEKLPTNIASYLKSENEYSSSFFSSLKNLEEKLIKEMRSRIKEEDESVPSTYGIYVYYERYCDGAQYPLFCRKEKLNSEETILLDVEKEAEDHEYFDMGSCAPSPNQQYFAWNVDLTGAENYTIYIRNTKTLQDEDKILNAKDAIIWGENSDHLYYIELDNAKRPWRVMRHIIGESQEQDIEIYREESSGWFLEISSSQDGKYAFITIHDHATSELRIIDIVDQNSEQKLLLPRKSGIEYEAEHYEGKLILRTNAKAAEDFQIFSISLEIFEKSPENWISEAQLLVPEKKGEIILSIDVLQNYLLWETLSENGSIVYAKSWETGEIQTFAPRAPIGEIELSLGWEYETDNINLSFSSPINPEITIEKNLKTGEEKLLKEEKIPSGHNPQEYITQRVFASASDGETIPITLIYKENTRIDGSAPLLLYGYGSYGVPIPADFRTRRLSLVDRGFIYAIAHIRGGLEKGYRWHKEGRMENKENTFSDFIACADFLIENSYTSSGKIVAHGGSAGGMLMGVVANRAGEKFAGIIAEVPFVDCLNTILDESLPLTPPEWVEWGNPITDKWAFETIKNYAPYENIEAKKYPPMLVTAGLSDPRVTYWEPAKFVAKLRDKMTEGGPIFLYTQMEAGHAGSTGRFDSLEDSARNYSFALACVE